MRFSTLYRILCLTLALGWAGSLSGLRAQTFAHPDQATESTPADNRAPSSLKSNADSLTVQPRYGIVSYDSLLHAMPEYAKARQSLARLRSQYDEETEYNASNFKRLFVEFLDGQKNFPKSILLKRQRDLQNEMERDIAFRQKADSLLRAAEEDLMRPVLTILNHAIRAVGVERGYDLIINTDQNVHLYYNRKLAEDAMPYVRAKLKNK